MNRMNKIVSQLQPNPVSCPWKEKHLQEHQQQQQQQQKPPVNVVVTGAAGNIGYAVLFMIARGCMLGEDQPINLRLLDIPPMVGLVLSFFLPMCITKFSVCRSSPLIPSTRPLLL